MPSDKEIDAAVEAVYRLEVERCGKPSDFEELTKQYWRKRVVAVLVAAEEVRAADIRE